MPGENNMNGSENGTDNGQSTQGFRGTESIGFVTNEVVAPGQSVQLSNEGYNVSAERTAAQNVVETAQKMGEASVQLQETSARIAGNVEASAEVRNPAILAMEGIKRFAEWRRNANTAAAERERERSSRSQYPAEFVRQSQTVGESASQLITQQGNAARSQEQSDRFLQNGPAGTARMIGEQLLTNATREQVNGAINKSEKLENGREARRWRDLIAKSEKHASRAELYGRIVDGLNHLISMTRDTSRRKELERQSVAQTQNVAQAQNQYAAALQGQMGAAYSGR